MNVKLARIKAGLTQEELRKLVKISPAKLCKVERCDYDSLTFANMRDFARVLKCSIKELFFSDIE